MCRAGSGFHQVVYFIRERDQSEAVALPLGRNAKEEGRGDRAVQMTRCFGGRLKRGAFGKLTRAETGSIKRKIDFLRSLQLEDFRDRKPPFGGRFPVDLIEAVSSFVLSQFLKFSSSANLWLGVHADCAAIQKVRDLFSFDPQVRVDADFAVDGSMVTMNPETERGTPIKIKAVKMERTTRGAHERNSNECFGRGLGEPG